MNIETKRVALMIVEGVWLAKKIVPILQITSSHITLKVLCN